MVAQEQPGQRFAVGEVSHAGSTGAYAMLAALCALALALGAFGLGYGLPFFSHIDEPHVVERASRVAHGHTLNPGWFGHPGSTVIYPLAGIYKVHSAIAHGVPLWRPDPVAYATLHRESLRFATPDAAPYYLLARTLSLTYFVGAVALTFVLGAQAFNRRTGLLAAAMVASSAVFLEYARIARTDTAGAFYTLLALIACLRLLRAPGWQHYILAGLAIGLAGATRYLCLSLGVALLAAHGFSGAWRNQRGWYLLLVGLAAIPVGFLAVTPALPFALGTVYRNLMTEARDSWLPLSYPAKVWWYVANGVPLVLSWPLWLAALGGAALTVRRGSQSARLLVLVAAIFLLVIALPALYHRRWVLSIAPVLYVLAAALLWAAVETLRKTLGWRRHVAQASAVLLALSMAGPLAATVQQSYLVARPDTREQALRWISAHVPPGARIATESYAGLIVGDYQVTTPFHLFRLGPFDQALTTQYDYFVTTDLNYGRYYEAAARHPEDVAFYEEAIAFYSRLFRSELLAEFRPGPWTAQGPVVRIYRSPGSSLP